MRRPHRLKPNKRAERIRNIVFFDTESRITRKKDREVHHPYLVVARYVSLIRDRYQLCEERVFTDVKEFWDWIDRIVRTKKCYYLVSHNVTYDLIVTGGLRQLFEKGWRATVLYQKGLTFIMKLKNGNRSICLLSLSNYFRSSLKEIGESFGLKKLEINYQTASLKEAIEYCRRDVLIVEKAFLYLLELFYEEDLGSVGLTISSCAYNAFRHAFMKDAIFIHNNEGALKAERSAYYGGRNECFYIGQVMDKQLYKLDVVSMYPSVMKDNFFPVKLVGGRADPPDEMLEILSDKYLYIVDVEFETDKPIVPVRIKKKVCYPTGRIRGWFCDPEFQLIKKEAKIIKVHYVYVYRKAKIFEEFVNYFYKMRKEAKEMGLKAKDFLYKTLMNSLYGKFGQKGGAWVTTGQTEDWKAEFLRVYYPDTREWVSYRIVGNLVQEKVEEGETENSFPAISAFVTSYARVKLWEYIKTAGFGHVYYCDTDSLIVDQEGYDRLKEAGAIGDDELGKLKLEETAFYAWFRSPKDYVFGDKEVIKGITRDAEKLDHNVYRIREWPSLATMIHLGVLDEYYTILKEKKLRRIYDKGVVGEDGWVRPYRIDIDVILDLVPSVTEEEAREEAEMEALIEALEVNRLIPARYMLRRWDYRRNRPKGVRLKDGKVVSWDKAIYDEEATELGFDSAEELIEAMYKQAEYDRKIRELREELRMSRYRGP